MASDNTDEDYSIESEVSDCLFASGEWNRSKSEESKVFQNVSGLTCFIHLYEPMADELLLKQDEKEQGKPKVVANDGKWMPRTEIR